MPIARKISGETPRKAADASSKLSPKPETISAMLEARSMHLSRFTSAKQFFNQLNEAAENNRVVKKSA